MYILTQSFVREKDIIKTEEIEYYQCTQRGIKFVTNFRWTAANCANKVDVLLIK